MTDVNQCPICGKPKKPWFKLCYECNEKEKKIPVCEVCGVEVPEGHYLCKEHWKERKEQERDLKKIEYVKEMKKMDFKEKFKGKYYFNSIPLKSKSELIICYFFDKNKIPVAYERTITLNGIDYKPDFIIEDKDNNTIIIEHFGYDGEEYVKKKKEKIRQYKKLCDEKSKFYFIMTDEDDIKDINERLGKKLNETPLKRAYWS
jgi:predicted nuclease of restriction endonuclease-like RecB superfamily